MRGASKTLAALVLALALAAPATAGAAGPTGNTTLVLGKAKAKLLAERGVAFGGMAGADTEGRQTRLQISGGTIGVDAVRLSHEGALRFVAGQGRARRAVRLGAPRLELSPLRSVLSAKLGGKRRVVFDLRMPPGALATDTAKGSAQLRGARLTWRRSLASSIGERLGAELPRGALGTLRASAAAVVGDEPQQGALGSEPPLLARPASAVDVSAATLTWHVRDSWIRYANTQMASEAIEGASPGPAIAESSHPCPDRPAGTDPTLVYSYSFPFSNGWYDPPTGTTALYQSGGVRFSYPAHGIDLTTRSPEIEINGAASRAIFRLRSSAYQDVRAPILELAASDPPVEGPAGTFTYAAPVRGALTADGQSVFAGFYAPPNNGFGCFSISFTTA